MKLLEKRTNNKFESENWLIWKQGKNYFIMPATTIVETPITYENPFYLRPKAFKLTELKELGSLINTIN